MLSGARAGVGSDVRLVPSMMLMLIGHGACAIGTRNSTSNAPHEIDPSYRIFLPAVAIPDQRMSTAVEAARRSRASRLSGPAPSWLTSSAAPRSATFFMNIACWT